MLERLNRLAYDFDGSRLKEQAPPTPLQRAGEYVFETAQQCAAPGLDTRNRLLQRAVQERLQRGR
jgi:hypothetical protein